MRIRMTHRAYKGAANVLPDDQAQWEAAGWVADHSPIRPVSDTHEHVPADYETTIEDKEPEE